MSLLLNFRWNHRHEWEQHYMPISRRKYILPINCKLHTGYFKLVQLTKPFPCSMTVMVSGVPKMCWKPFSWHKNMSWYLLFVNHLSRVTHAPALRTLLLVSRGLHLEIFHQLWKCWQHFFELSHLWVQAHRAGVLKTEKRNSRIWVLQALTSIHR